MYIFTETQVVHMHTLRPSSENSSEGSPVEPCWLSIGRYLGLSKSYSIFVVSPLLAVIHFVKVFLSIHLPDYPLMQEKT